MGRDSFIFYKEYKEAIDSIKNDNKKLQFYQCITDYTFYDIIPDNIDREIRAMFILIKDKLDKVNTSYWNFEDRRSSKYKVWKKSVLKRDNYTCKKCGNKNDLVVHHIKSFASDKELRFNINNGVTLCQSCHKEEHQK